MFVFILISGRLRELSEPQIIPSLMFEINKLSPTDGDTNRQKRARPISIDAPDGRVTITGRAETRDGVRVLLVWFGLINWPGQRKYGKNNIITTMLDCV